MFRQARVVEIGRKRPGLTEAQVDIDGRLAPAVSYDDLCGEISVDDEVIVNTTAVDLNLGSGGVHFVLWNLGRRDFSPPASGHIMKLRYTPLQIACLAAEEQESEYHSIVKEKIDIAGMPVVIGGVHSQLPAAAVTIKKLSPQTRIAYLMTDAAALPIAFSNLVAELKKKGLLDTTITVGNAFGGDLEAVNIFSALTIAQAAARADVAIVAMGPGITGTDSTLGFSGIEQGVVINAVNSLQGKAIAAARISFADSRQRHRGVSHHTLTSLSVAALTSALVAIPEMESKKQATVQRQLEAYSIPSKHRVEIVKNETTIPALKEYGIGVTTMSREVEDDPEFFMAAGAAGIEAVKALGE